MTTPEAPTLQHDACHAKPKTKKHKRALREPNQDKSGLGAALIDCPAEFFFPVLVGYGVRMASKICKNVLALQMQAVGRDTTCWCATIHLSAPNREFPAAKSQLRANSQHKN